MRYWKCSCELYFHPVMREITKPIHPRDGFMVARESIFFKLLSLSANGNSFDCAEQFAGYTRMPDKQCQVVWDVCVANNVLRKDANGISFSAREWMSETGLLPCAQNAPKRAQTDEAIKHTSEAQTSQKGAVLCEELPRLGKPPKVAVRPNVFLTEEELNTLREKFSEEQVTMMLDKLSAFKTDKGWRYRSDYDAINRWVIKWLGQEMGRREIERESVQSFYETHAGGNDVLSWMKEG